MDWMTLPLRRYAEFSGRSRRKEYWMFALLMTIVYAIGGVLMFSGFAAIMAAGSSGAPDPAAYSNLPVTFWIGAVILGLFTLAILVPGLAVTVRRLHDRDLSGWWYLGVAIGGQIPFLGPLISLGFLVLMCLPGTPGPNRFGNDPKDPLNTEVFA
jgi:uncharacterized membrane protein YhaH (DUF805 family)